MVDVDVRHSVRRSASRPMPSPVGAVDGRRVLIASAGVIMVALGVVQVVRSLPNTGAASALAVALGLLVVPLVASPLEWFVHRFVYHEAVVRPLRTIFAVHSAHHFTYFPTWRYVTGGPPRRLSIKMVAPVAHASPLRNSGVRLAHFSWYLAIGAVVVWLPGWLLTSDLWFLGGLVVASAVVSNLFIVVHDTIHRPGSHRIVEAQPWFGFLDRHHYIHHVALGANLNFLLPLADLLFGTLRTEMTPEELERHGPLVFAKAALVGEGERARVDVR